ACAGMTTTGDGSSLVSRLSSLVSRLSSLVSRLSSLVSRLSSLVSRLSKHPRWRSLLPRLDLRARRDPVAGDHLRVAHAATGHRIDAGIGIDDDFEQRRAVERDELGDRCRDLVGPLDAFRPGEIVGLGGLDEVLLVQALVRRREASLEEQLLPLPDHAVAVVV